MTKKKATSKKAIESKVNHDYYIKAVERLEGVVSRLTDRIEEVEIVVAASRHKKRWWQWWT